jgi:hypothetical protein
MAGWLELDLVIFAGQCFRCGFLGRRVFRVGEWTEFVGKNFNGGQPGEAEIFARLFAKRQEGPP